MGPGQHSRNRAGDGGGTTQGDTDSNSESPYVVQSPPMNRQLQGQGKEKEHLANKQKPFKYCPQYIPTL